MSAVGPPLGALISIAGYTLPTSPSQSSVPSLVPSVRRSYGISLNSPHPLNRDATNARFDSQKITWQFLARAADASTTPYKDLVAILRTLYVAVYRTAQIGTVVANIDNAGTGTLSFTGAIASMDLAITHVNIYHYVASITVDVLSDFA